MGELAFNLGLLVLTLMLAAAGAAVAGWYQNRNWQNRHWQEMRQQKIASATLVVQDVAKLLDRRLYRQRRLIWAVRRGSVTELDRSLEDYRAVLFEWMDNLGQLKAHLWQSFDRYTALNFEDHFHARFASVGKRIEAAVRSGKSATLATEEHELNLLGREIYEFVYSLLDRISQERIAGLVGRDAVAYENWDNLSIALLWKRLFGLPTA